MTGINFDKWSPIPNSEIDNLCRNKHDLAKSGLSAQSWQFKSYLRVTSSQTTKYKN